MKFVQLAPNILTSAYFLQSPYTDSRTPYYYTKLRLKGTKYIEYGNHRLNIEQGIYVDIYPIDYLPDDEILYKEKWMEYQKWIRLYVLRQCPFRYAKSQSIKDVIKGSIRFGCSMLMRLVPLKFWVKKIDTIMTTYNDVRTGKMGNYSYPVPNNYFDKVFPLVSVSFNGVSVKIPNGWEKHLYRRYGDWKELPPPEARIGHKPYILEFGDF